MWLLKYNGDGKSKIKIIPNPKQILNPKSKLFHWDFVPHQNKIQRDPACGKIGIYLVLLVVFVVLGFKLDCFAQPISSAELINNAKLYDGKTVVYEGEAIGDIMVRGEFAWINVNDGQNAIGIWLHKDLTKDIFYTGSYKSKGDWVQIAGVFQRACPQHGGDLDIHAQAIRKISEGRTTQEILNLSKRNLVFVLLGILCLVLILRRLRIR